MGSELFDPIRAMAKITNSVIIGFSGGKESLCLLDLCSKFFKNVYAFFMYQVPGMSFWDATIDYYSKRYGIEIIKLPHFETSEFLRYGLYRPQDPTVPIIGVNDIYAFVRQRFGVDWIACGERIDDSVYRRAMIKKSGSIDTIRLRFYPLAYWAVADVRRYMRQNRLFIDAVQKKLGYSFRGLDAKTLKALRDDFPKDFARVKKIYPLCEMGLVNDYKIPEV